MDSFTPTVVWLALIVLPLTLIGGMAIFTNSGNADRDGFFAFGFFMGPFGIFKKSGTKENGRGGANRDTD